VLTNSSLKTFVVPSVSKKASPPFLSSDKYERNSLQPLVVLTKNNPGASVDETYFLTAKKLVTVAFLDVSSAHPQLQSIIACATCETRYSSRIRVFAAFRPLGNSVLPVVNENFLYLKPIIYLH
jgi:hypothetical protein